MGKAMRVTLPGFCLALPSSELLATVKRCAVVAVTATLAWSFLCACLPANAQVANWIDSWTASPQRGVMPTSFSNRTIRQIGHVSVGGTKVRLRLSNEFGRRPLLIGAASVALAGKGARTAAGSTRTVTFGGTKSIIIPPGAPMLSDPIELTVRPLSDVAVNLYLPAATDLATVHTTGLQTAYVSASGDYTGSAEFPVADRFANRFFLAAVMVDPGMPARAIVAFGDSITDGTASTVNANWPDVLARRLKDAGIALAVLNQGIAGNRVLSDGAGVSALARFERDVLSLPAISHVIVLIGINDIGWPGTAIEPNGVVRTPDEIIAGYKQLIERAHVRGLKVFGSPLTPFAGQQFRVDRLRRHCHVPSRLPIVGILWKMQAQHSWARSGNRCGRSVQRSAQRRDHEIEP
jgi:hypothetical protein